MTASILGPAKLAALRHALTFVAHVPGAAAECGVYKGGTLREIATARPWSTVYGFDTFTGLPAEKWDASEPHGVGDFADTTLESVRKIACDGLRNVVLVPGIFPESTKVISANADVRPFAFVHLDFDFYESTAEAIEWFRPRMSPGGVIVFDDYDWKNCPGVRRAIEEAGLPVKPLTRFQVYWRAPT